MINTPSLDSGGTGTPGKGGVGAHGQDPEWRTRPGDLPCKGTESFVDRPPTEEYGSGRSESMGREVRGSARRPER